MNKNSDAGMNKLKPVDHLIAFELFILTLIITYLFSRIGVDSNHDGVLLKPAQDLASGLILHKDTFTQYGTLTIRLYAIFLEIFGNRLLSIKLAGSVFYGLTGGVVWLISRKLMTPLWSLLSTLFWLCLSPYLVFQFHQWPSIYGSYFYVVTVYILLQSFQKNKASQLRIESKKLFIIGMLSGLAFFFKQPYLILFLSNIALLSVFYFMKLIVLNEFKRNLIALSSGFLIIVLLILLIVILQGALLDFVKQTFWIGYIWGRIIGLSFDLSNAIRYLILERPLWVFIPIFMLFTILNELRKFTIQKSNIFDVSVFAGTFVGSFNFVQYYPIYDDRHMYWAITPVISFFVYHFKVYLFSSNINIFYGLLKYVVLMVFVASLAVEVRYRIPVIYDKINKDYVTVDRPEVLAGMKTEPHIADYYLNFSKLLEYYFGEFPEKNLINLNMDTIYMTFVDNSKNINTLYGEFSGFTSGVYPYVNDLTEYANENRPLIITTMDYDPKIVDYCVIFMDDEKNVRLLMPVENEIESVRCISNLP